MTLKAFVVGMHDGESWKEPRVFAAETKEHAARLAFPDFPARRIALILSGDDDYTVSRYSGFDRLITEATSAGRLNATIEDERLAGWASEDDGPSCDSCGLYSCDLDKYAVCSECGNCAVCGHWPDCDAVKALEGQKDA